MYGRRGTDWILVSIYGIIIISVIMMFALIIITLFETSKCHQKGGKMVGTGEYSTIVMSAGDGVYTTMETENKACDKE
ncbi:hypothetical protein [Bacillus phage vB_BanS-Thrax3]|nr:hypothetical protein [Bacillus phage vB_BanS-Thrax3]